MVFGSVWGVKNRFVKPLNPEIIQVKRNFLNHRCDMKNKKKKKKTTKQKSITHTVFFSSSEQSFTMYRCTRKHNLPYHSCSLFQCSTVRSRFYDSIQQVNVFVSRQHFLHYNFAVIVGVFCFVLFLEFHIVNWF